MNHIFQRWKKAESGQSLVEFAIILPILMLLLTLPVDFFRYLNTKMLLSSAAGESIGQLNYAAASSATAEDDILDTMSAYYGDRLDAGKVQVAKYDTGAINKKNYTYYVYTSDKATPDPAHYWDQFDDRPSSYQCMEVQVQFSYEVPTVTFWGTLFLGNTYEVLTPVYTRSIYAGGYTS